MEELSEQACGSAAGLTTRGLAAGLLLALFAWASSGGLAPPADPFARDLAERRQVQIQVKNLKYSDAAIWVLARQRYRQRLGIVTGKTDAVRTFSWTFSEPLRVEFDLLADVRCVTDELTVDAGDILELVISVDRSRDPQCRQVPAMAAAPLHRRGRPLLKLGWPGPLETGAAGGRKGVRALG